MTDFVTPQEACNLNELYSQHIKDAPEEVLMEINQLGHFIPTQLKSGQTLSHLNGHSVYLTILRMLNYSP